MDFFMWVYKTYVFDSEYAVIAQKNADPEFLNAFDELFAKEYGLSLDSLMIRFENRLSGIDQRATQAEQRATQAEQQLALILNSRSWKITKPLRTLGDIARRLVKGTK